MYPWEYVTISILRFKPTSLYVFVSLIRQVCDVPAVLLTITKSSERERVMFEIPIKPRNGERRIVYLDIVSWKADLFAAALSEIQSLWKSFAITSVINIIFPFYTFNFASTFKYEEFDIYSWFSIRRFCSFIFSKKYRANKRHFDFAQ